MLLSYIKLFKFKKKWRKLNKHNSTGAYNVFPPELVKVGRYTYGSLNVLSFNNNSKLKIGDFCSIGPNVVFILSADHYLNRLSTFPFRTRFSHVSESISKGNIVIEDDVWIGYGAIILSGIHIGQGAVIAAGSVVTKDVPKYAIVGGNPAKIIKYRFSNEIVDILSDQMNYELLDSEKVAKNLDKLYCKISDFNKNQLQKTIREILNKGR